MTNAKRMIRNSTIAIGAMLVLAGPIAAPSAMAGGKPKVHFGVHIGSGFHGYGSPYGYAGYAGAYNPCHWLKRRWLRTGNPKWHWRYKNCLWRYY